MLFCKVSLAIFAVVSLAYKLPACNADSRDNVLNTSIDTDLSLGQFGSGQAGQCHDHSWIREKDCKCGSDLDGIVSCVESEYVFIKSQFCMTIHGDFGEEVVGRCPYTYLKFNDPNVTSIGLFYKVPPDIHNLDNVLCNRFNRHGLLCSKCNKGYGYSMYPDFRVCVKCQPKDFARNTVTYIAISFGPLTLFLVLVVCFRINAASAPMNAFIFISQVFTQPPFTRGFIRTIDGSFLPHSANVFMKILFSLYGIWNLNFFVSFIPRFCLPHESAFDIIMLSYAIALYPLVVLVLLYLCIELYSRDFRILVWLWKPFHICYSRFKRHWDIRASIIDAFATFLLLSYTKILFISVDVLAPSTLWLKNGSTVGVVSYFDASFKLSPNPRTVLTIIGILLLMFICTLLPTILLLLYPCGFCQSCLTRTRLHFQSLHFLMYSFNGCYKDGTTYRLDCRFFAAFFLIARMVINIQYIVLYYNYTTSVAITSIALAIAIAAMQPYRKAYSHFNRLDPLMIFFLVIWLVSYRDIRLVAGKHVSLQKFWMALCYISLVAPLVIVVLYSINFTKLKKWCHSWKPSSSSSLEQSLEQRCHTPHALRLSSCRYVSADIEFKQGSFS